MGVNGFQAIFKPEGESYFLCRYRLAGSSTRAVTAAFVERGLPKRRYLRECGVNPLHTPLEVSDSSAARACRQPASRQLTVAFPVGPVGNGNSPQHGH